VKVEEAMAFVIATLTDGPHILGKRFSAADVLYATTFAMFAASPMLPKTPVIEDYVKRCLERPAYARAMAKDGGQ
jgi:glutathione S-transferase